MQFTGIASNELLNQLQQLCLSERDLTTQIVLHIAELEQREAFARTAYLSALGYCTQCLGLSDDEAWRRVSVAKMVVALPATGVALEKRVVTLSTLLMIRHMLTAENCEHVLASIANKSKREIEVVLASLDPKRECPARINGQSAIGLLPSTSTNSESASTSLQLSTPKSEQQRHPKNRGSIAPVAPARHKVEFTVGTELRDKIEHATRLMSHVVGDDFSLVIERALDLLIDKLEREKLSAIRDNAHSPMRRGIVVRRGSWLEFDHIRPQAHGGGGDLENVRLLCKHHNRQEACRIFGAQHVKREIIASRQARAAKRGGIRDRRAATKVDGR